MGRPALVLSGMLVLMVMAHTACIVMSRKPAARLHAISDGKFTLGAVPIERDDGAQAYHLLLCNMKKSAPTAAPIRGLSFL